MASSALYSWIQRVWYEKTAGVVLLAPLAIVFRMLQACRTALYRAGILRRVDVGVPVVVVGNITAGGTGKTPTAAWLACELRSRGFRPGIVSRGYAGNRSSGTMAVHANSDPAIAGDEPVLLARRSNCPVATDVNRARAAATLVDTGCDVIIADDGLQHYRLRRCFEICIVDGLRGLGNGWPLPAGPLREPPSRLASVDQVLVNGGSPGVVTLPESLAASPVSFDLVASEVRHLKSGSVEPIAHFANRTVHALAAIGNPHRFFDLLRGHGMQVTEHALPDHARPGPKDFDFDDESDILVTEKDAVKLGTEINDRVWVVPVDLKMDADDAERLLTRIAARLQKRAAAS